MAKYNPFFERADMIRVDYNRALTVEEKKMKQFLESLDFDFDFIKSKTYCNDFYGKLTPQNKKNLLELLTDFAHQPFIKTKKITPNLLTNTFSSKATYLYWINASTFSKETDAYKITSISKKNIAI